VKLWSCVFGISLFGQTLTLEKERALGSGLAAEIRRQARPFDIPVVSAYVARVGERLAASVPGGSFRFEVVVAEGTEPIGLPGGFVLVPASFLLAAEDEAEFAGMVAHAMGHVFLRHGFVKARQPKEGTIPLFMGGWAGVHADTHHRNAWMPATFVDSLREYELEADRFGADLAGRAGYDPAALRNYIRRVQPEASPSVRVSPLPAKAERLAALEQASDPAGEVGGSEFLRVREMVQVALQSPARKAPSLRR
jgi:predicted Zn-dependent protease